MSKPKIIILAGGGHSTNMVYHSLARDFDIEGIIIERPGQKSRMIKRRAKRLGWPKVIGQLFFMLFVKVLNIESKNRIRQITLSNHLDGNPPPEEKTHRVPTVNDEQTIQLLNNFSSKLVVVNGTRIISKKVLNTVDKTFINTHAGITPIYRGVHGGYWALANGDSDNCGVTVHLIDPGIDTGDIIYQENIEVTPKDNFVTYPLLQLVAGIPILKKAISDFHAGELKVIEPRPQSPSKLYYHPTLIEYLKNRMFNNIR